MKTLEGILLLFLFIAMLFSCNRNTNEARERISEQNIVGDITIFDEFTESNEIELESFFNPYLFVLEEVEVYDFPDIITGKIIYTLEMYEDIFFVGRSVVTFEINGINDHWTKITSPVVGWVFAAKFAQ
ncbi:MAG: hypothetical protein LBC80_04345 [Treponema sp.]|jgi:predicted methyltransferase|nr:hypothetical protein [Treponema sp.]